MSERLTMNRKEFAARVGISVRTLDTLLAEGQVSFAHRIARPLYRRARRGAAEEVRGEGARAQGQAAR
jgi:hypothetical protein